MVTAFPTHASPHALLCRVAGSGEFLFVNFRLSPRPGDLVAARRRDGLYVEPYRGQPFVGVIVPAKGFAKFAGHPQ